MSTRGIRAGRAFVELLADDNALYRSLDKASARLKAFGNTAVSIGAKSAATGGAVLAPLGKAFSDALTKGADIKAIATKFGQGVGSISELAGAFEFAGIGVQGFGELVDGLAAKVKSAADAAGPLDEQLLSLGRARNFEKLPLTDQLDKLADALGRIPDDTQRAVKAQEFFGASAAKLLPYLKDGAAGIARMKAEGRRAGAVMSVEDINRAAEASKAFNTILLEIATTIVKVGSALMPATDQTKTMSDQIRDVFAAGREWVATNGQIIGTIAKVAAGAVGAGVVLGGIGASVKLLAPIFSGAVSGIKGIVGGLGLLKSPLGILGFGISGLAGLWLTCTENGQKAAADIGKAFTNIANTFKDAWGGIISAVGKGDLGTAFKIAGVGIKAVWLELLISLGKAFSAFIEDNRRKLMVLAALSGGAKGGRLGSVFGPYGTAAGALIGAGGAALATDALIDELADVGKNPRMEAALAQAKRDIRELVAKAKAPGGGIGLDDQIKKGLEAERERFASYGKRIEEAATEALNLGNRQKGIFSGPVQQQLGVGQDVAKRQLDQLVGINAAAKKNADLQGQMVGEIQKVLGLVVWN